MTTANAGYEIVKVVVNGNENPITNPANAGGFYCFAVKEGGEFKVEINPVA